VVDEQLNVAAPVKNISNQANNNDPHDVVDEQSNDTAAPVCYIADSMDNNEQLNDAAHVENVSNHAINNDCREMADGLLIEAVVGNGNIETHYATIHNNGTTLTALSGTVCDWRCTSVDSNSRFSHMTGFTLGEGLNFVGQGRGRGNEEVGDKEEDSGSGDQKRNARKRKRAPEGEEGKRDNEEDENGNGDQKRKAHKKRFSKS
jgi:hypothetical protein